MPVTDETAGLRPGRMGVGVIGAGRVGAVLGSTLRAAGHAIVGVSAVSDESIDRAEMMLQGVPILPIPQIVERSELVLLAVPDDALADLVAGIANSLGWQIGQLVVHVSGAHGLEILGPAAAQGAIPLAIHPAMTFTGTSLDVSRLEGAPFAVTASSPFLPIAQALVVEMGGEPVVVGEGARVAYHAALSHASNHLVTLLAQASEMLQEAGVSEPGHLLAGIVHASAEGALRYASEGADPIGALTGPVSRGDAGTVARHLDALARITAEGAGGDLVPTYRALARSTAARAYGAGRLDAGALTRIMTALDPVPGALDETRARHDEDDEEGGAQ
ncbi:DUF2520 domain-containing protein [Rarobacter faecitabidus]|uniref:Putative short-subunit dehydrogenase-like oxidoreductase (DUF2520 family) n=1 Tax=Rarobacter faecitabidus TaxID=13243 RepID=A0A542ZTK0_RARFA|nr:DUF2520 domain-containing protein [Rarobacter faecitabidus]TQL63683.1 putative short-subunit dehydrogenase-like oxidoreductase (DUF2520 family) [Rarobacter faecitabidus]